MLNKHCSKITDHTWHFPAYSNLSDLEKFVSDQESLFLWICFIKLEENLFNLSNFACLKLEWLRECLSQSLPPLYAAQDFVDNVRSNVNLPETNHLPAVENE